MGRRVVYPDGGNATKKIRTESEFSETWNEAEALVCDFGASWCGPCKMLEPVLKKLEKECPDIVFVNVDIDENEELSEAHKVQYVPTVLFVRKGRVLRRTVGLESYEVLSREAKRLLRPAKGK